MHAHKTSFHKHIDACKSCLPYKYAVYLMLVCISEIIRLPSKLLLCAADVGRLNYLIIGGNSPLYKFGVKSATGGLFVAKTLDYESSDRVRKTKYV